MYNTCNTNYSHNSCGCNSSYATNLGNRILNLLFTTNGNCNCCRYYNGCYGYGTCSQRICRDCCGNIWVRQTTNCNCGCNNGCGCGNNGNGSTSSNNGNGNGQGFACVTFCGNSSNSSGQTTTSTAYNYDEYYARQYGLNGYGGGCAARGSQCGCNYNG